MKKFTLTIVCAMAMTGAAFAQGFVNWVLPTADVTFETNAAAYSPLFGGGSTGNNTAFGLTSTTAGGFYYALLFQSTPNGVLSSDTQVWDGTWSGAAGDGGVAMLGTNSTSNLSGHGAALPELVNGVSGTGVQVNWANGTTNSVILVGWSANMGTTWLAVSNTLASGVFAANEFFGETSIGDINPASGAPGNNIFASSGAATATGTPIFDLNTPLYLLPTPEPASIALAGLGGLSMLLFRRRKS
jgi:hypothetical protein